MLRIASRTAAALALAAAPALAADSYVVDASHSEATFRIRHLTISDVSGRFNELEGRIQIDEAEPSASSVSFTIKAASIDTKDERRDQHLRSPDFFDVEEHPEITFSSSKVEPRGDDLYHVTGTLTMHGVSKEVTLPVRHLGFVKDPWGNERAGFEIETTLDRKDYGLVWNRTLDSGGFVLGDEVKVRIAIEATKQKEA